MIAIPDHEYMFVPMRFMKTLNRIFPVPADNHYQGTLAALYFFYVITGATLVRSLIHIIAADGGAQSIATIPLAHYRADATAAVILIFSYWGISQLIAGLVYLLVGLFYRSLVPLMYLLLFLEYSLRLLLDHLKPMHTMVVPPGSYGNYVMIPLALLLFFLSLNPWNRTMTPNDPVAKS